MRNLEKFAEEMAQKHGLEKSASGVGVFNLHDFEGNDPTMLTAFVQKLHDVNSAAFDGGKGFSAQTFDLLEQQVALIEDALKSIFPALEQLQTEIFESA